MHSVLLPGVPTQDVPTPALSSPLSTLSLPLTLLPLTFLVPSTERLTRTFSRFVAVLPASSAGSCNASTLDGSLLTLDRSLLSLDRSLCLTLDRSLLTLDRSPLTTHTLANSFVTGIAVTHTHFGTQPLGRLVMEKKKRCCLLVLN